MLKKAKPEVRVVRATADGERAETLSFGSAVIIEPSSPVRAANCFRAKQFVQANKSDKLSLNGSEETLAPTQRREAELEVAESRITRRGGIRSEFIGATAQAEQLERRR